MSSTIDPAKIRAMDDIEVRARAKKLGVTEATIRKVHELVCTSELARKVAPFVVWFVEQCKDYQLEYIFADSRRMVWVKSRQIGGSFAVACKLVARALSGRRQVVISASGDQAEEVMSKVNDVLEALTKVFDQEFINRKAANNTTMVTLFNGVRITARPANHRTARGFTGDVIWDEAGVTPFDALIFKALAPVAARGDFQLDLIGTPFGADGVFYEAAEGQFKEQYKQLRTTLQDAIADGAPLNEADLRGQYTPEDFDQEFGCSFLESGGGYFLRASLQAAVALGVDILEGRRRVLPPPERFIGIDVGRKRDVTAICIGEKGSDGLVRQIAPVETLVRMPFPEQLRRFEELIRDHKPTRVLVDEGGMGGPLVEELQLRFPGIVIGVQFGGNELSVDGSKNNKRTMVEHARKQLDRRALALHPDDADTAKEMRLIRRNFTRSGNIVFDAERNEDGHADRATALIMMTWAATGERDGYVDDVPLDGPQAEVQASAPMKSEVQQWVEQHRSVGVSAYDWWEDEEAEPGSDDWDPLG
jgi:phage FluMu gp28-like protein